MLGGLRRRFKERSALKHGLFRARVMLCDRCAWNTKCKHFKRGGSVIVGEEGFKSTINRQVAFLFILMLNIVFA